MRGFIRIGRLASGSAGDLYVLDEGATFNTDDVFAFSVGADGPLRTDSRLRCAGDYVWKATALGELVFKVPN